MGLESFFASKGLISFGRSSGRGRSSDQGKRGYGSELGQRFPLWASLTCGDRMWYHMALSVPSRA